MARATIAIAALSAFLSATAGAEDVFTPPRLDDLKNIERSESVIADDLKGLRAKSMREVALAYGSQSGLVAFTYETQQWLKDLKTAQNLTQTFAFRDLMIDGPAGIMVMPPVISRSETNLRFDDAREGVSMADVEYIMQRPAFLLTAAPSWRDYLLRDYGTVEKPANEMLPKNSKEQEQWNRWVEEGWQAGKEQAEAIFAADLARLNRDFFGIILYHRLVLERKVNELRVALGSGGPRLGNGTLRIGDRWVKITEHAAFNGDYSKWRPVIVGRLPAELDNHGGWK